jgi:hypothetical protein
VDCHASQRQGEEQHQLATVVEGMSERQELEEKMEQALQ